jgi:hypothetical protein
LAAGSAVAESPTPIATLNPAGTLPAATPANSTASTAGNTTQGSGNPPYLLLPLVLVLIILFALLVFWRRRPRRLEGPDAVYRNVVKLASRLGYKPAPTQTMYEYTGMLADVVPQARDSLGVVAVAAVEVAYGRRQLGSDRLLSLATAHQLVRKSLLKLAVRLPKLRHRGAKNVGSAGRRGKARRGRR